MNSTSISVGSVNATKTQSLRRLARDARELAAAADAMPFIRAAPHGDNLHEWRVSFTAPDGPYNGVLFHAVLTIPDDYPSTPPIVRLCTNLPHPNVYQGMDFNTHRYDADGVFICLSMLRPQTTGGGSLYEGWSTAYSLTSILLQLSSFLFAENIPQDYGGAASARLSGEDVRRARNDADKFHRREGASYPELDMEKARSSATCSSASSSRRASAPAAIGRAIQGMDGRAWGTVVGDEGSVWRLSDGRIAKKYSRGSRWVWAPRPTPTTTAVATESLTLDRANSAEFPTLGAACATPARACTGTVDVAAAASPTRRRQRAVCLNTCCSETLCMCRLFGMTPHYGDEEDEAETGRALTRQRSADAAADEDTAAVDEIEAESPSGPFDDLCDDVLLRIAEGLTPEALIAASRSCAVLCQLVNKYCLLTRREAVCFHTKRSVADGALLGVGISLQKHSYSNDLASITATLDPLSQEAFDGGVRRGVWNEEFQLWCPLWVCDAHGERAMPVLERSLVRMGGGQRSFSPKLVLDLLPKIMNTFAVSMLSSADALHASERALTGYCAWHHLLLALCKRMPALRSEVNRRVDAFMVGRTSKADVKDLGEFIVLLSVSDRSWQEEAVAWQVLSECLDRQARWAMREDRSLESPDRLSEDSLLGRWFSAAATSMKLLMFQSYFLTNVARPAGRRPSDVLRYYERSFGRPGESMVRGLREACTDINAVGSWPRAFARLGLRTPAKLTMARRLQQAVRNSAQKGYHHGQGQQRGGGYQQRGQRYGGQRAGYRR